MKNVWHIISVQNSLFIMIKFYIQFFKHVYSYQLSLNNVALLASYHILTLKTFVTKNGIPL